MRELQDRPVELPVEAGTSEDDRPARAAVGADELGPVGWPAVVRAELKQRRRQLDGQLAGRKVLDLADPEGRARVLDPSGAGDAGFDAVVSVGALVTFPDLPLALRGIARVLAPAGWFLFVEPVSRPGWTGVMAASAGAMLRPVRGQHLGRDLPAALRRAGLPATDLERFTMPTVLWPLRPFVQGRARSFAASRQEGRA
jgi:SAM-dependent methyltransferase